MDRARTAATVELPAACRELVERVDLELTSFVAGERERMELEDPDAAPLFGELERVIGAGGKRLRPLFCCLGHLAAGGEVGVEAIRAAAALELLHTFALVHDDVMDRSASRRGSPSSWVHLAEEHRRAGYVGDPTSYGVAAAVLAGDMALVLADRALLGSGFPLAQLTPAQRRYDRMRVEVVAGQYLDVVAAHRGSATEAEARRIAVLKSGGYTVEAPVQIGAILAGAGKDLLECLSRYGVALGEAFQLRDDVLGTFGDPAVTGKDRDSDLREGKRTVLLAKALAAADGEDHRLLEERVGKPDLTSDELDRMRTVIDQLAGTAREALEPSLIPEPARGLLLQMSEVVAVRRA